MIARRVVVAADPDGRSYVQSDGESARLIEPASAPDFTGALVWSTDTTPGLASGPLADLSAVATSFVPAPGGTRLHLMHFPPDAAMAGSDVDWEALTTQQRAQMPGLADRFEADGMHTTDTLDYAVVIIGEIWLEVDDGEPTLIKAGDVVIQQGTHHAWRNRSGQIVTMVFLMIGAER